MGDLSRFEWIQDHANLIDFVMIDGSGNEVTGLAGGLTVQISKNGGAFAGAAGTQLEIGLGFYSYLCTVGESDTAGPVAIVATHASAIQQNLEYVVVNRASGLIAYTYPVTRSDNSNPIADATVEISTDLAGNNRIWVGTTDAFGHARDEFDNKPLLTSGNTYYFWTAKVGFTFDNPDTEVVS